MQDEEIEKSEVENTDEQVEDVVKDDQPDKSVESDSEDVSEEINHSEQTEEEPIEERKSSRRENLRIQKLVSTIRQKDEQLKQYAGMDYEKTLDADSETIKQLEKDRRSYGEDAYAQGIKQAESIQFHTRLEIDAPKIENKYPLLDSKSSDFNPAVADAINTMYLSTTGYDPQTNTVQNANIRYADYVESFMELVESVAGQKVANTTKNIARQAAVTGLRPDGSSSKMNLNQTPEAMSDEELDAVINAVIPRKR